MSKYEEEGVVPQLGDEIPTNWQKQAEAELANGYRILTVKKFRGNDETELHIFKPTPGIESEASELYSRVYTRGLRDPDLIPRKVLKKLLEEQGVWGKEEDALIDDIKESMRDIEYDVAKMRESGNINKDRMATLRKEWTNKKDELQILLVEYNLTLANSVEGFAEEAERKVKLSHCVKLADGTKVWPTIKEVDDETDSAVLREIVSEATLFWIGLTNEIINDLPADLIFGGGETNQTLSKEDEVPTEVLSDN